MILLLTMGCTQTVRFPPDLWPEEEDTGGTGDTGDTDLSGAPTIVAGIDETSISWGCNGANTAITASFQTKGWAGGANVALVGASATIGEAHPFLLEDSDPSGRWDRYTLGPLADDAATLTPGVSTTWRCGEDDTSITWAIWTTDRSGAAVDCVVWGPAPGEALQFIDSRNPAVSPLCRNLGIQP